MGQLQFRYAAAAESDLGLYQFEVAHPERSVLYRGKRDLALIGTIVVSRIVLTTSSQCSATSCH
jgi:hypothetical protein